MSQPENPFAPPRAEVADIAADGALTLAGRGTRLLAALLDTGVQIIAMAALNLVLPWSLFASNPAPGTMIATGLLSLLVFGLVQGWLLVQRGQTIGKVAL